MERLMGPIRQSPHAIAGRLQIAHTSYEAPDYSPYMGQYTVQGNGENNVKIGNYPIVNVYANVHIKHTRFFVMM
ncbi:hypothetical protein OBE_08597, partial [human gut metagenome]